MVITCAACGHRLTQQLTPVAPDFEPEWADEEEIVPRGAVWTKTGPWSVVWTPEGRAAAAASTEQYVVVNSNDVVGLEFDPHNVGSGCCGNSAHIRNRKCGACGTPVGTSISDCWTSYYEYFPADLVTLEPPPR